MFIDNRPQAIAQRRLNDISAGDTRGIAQRKSEPSVASAQGGLPSQLKQGIESLSGMSMDNVRVHYNSSQPAQLNAHAYAQGSDIHIAPGQEQHLPHEAWHVVQQAQGRVQPTMQAKGMQINSDKGLELEADRMGEQAAAIGSATVEQPLNERQETPMSSIQSTAQRVAQLAPDPTVATLHPVTGKPVVMNLVDVGTVVYHYDGTNKFYFKPITNEYFDNDHQPIPAPKGFNEDAAPAAVVVRPQDTFRGLTFTVDGSNRVTRAAGTIHKSHTAPETGRSSGAQMDSWEHVQSIHRSMFNAPVKSFNGGHIIAHHLGGSPGTNNMVPMEKNYNQSGAYKTFENSIDAQFGAHINTSLDIQIDVGYATDFADLMTQLVTADAGNKQTEMDGDANVKAMVMRTIGRIPKTITLTHLRTIGLLPVNKVVASPASPMTALRASLRQTYNIQNILSTSFDQTSTDREGTRKKTTRKPFAKSYGPHKGEDVAVHKDYHADYQSVYADMPRPGITEYIAGINGLAGGVKAYIWMDPMGVYDRFGGSGTIDTVDPLGIRWPYLSKATKVGGGGKIYKRGHLLNHELHGPGADSRNLLPITTRANGEMSSKFEEIVKKSEALVNPNKGVWWETRASATAVTRPLGWDRTAAALQGSANLFDEEAKLPRSLDCFAWEAIRVGGGIEKGRQFVNVTIQNNLPGDPVGELGITHAGPLANDAGINPKAAGGNNNVTGHAVTVPVAGNAGIYDRGYNKESGWLALNIATADTQRRYLSGLHDVAYDEGFANSAKPVALMLWTQAEQDTYNRAYQKGRDKGSFSQGYYGNAHSVVGNARADRQFDDGRYQRGLDTGNDLKASPGLDPGDLLMRGYFRGLYLRGKKDADADIVPASDQQDYVDGYRRALLDKAFDRGYDCLPMHDLGRGNFRYESEYREGQRRRGYWHGYDLKPAIDGQDFSYRWAYDSGMSDRGHEDGRNLTFQNWNFPNDTYQRNRRRGQYETGIEDGENLRVKQSFSRNYLDGWDEGARRRGHSDGYNARHSASGNANYVAGERSGMLKRIYDEAYDGVSVWRTTYALTTAERERAYDDGRYARGKSDGIRGWGRRDYDTHYEDGYSVGISIYRYRQRRRQRERRY